MTLSLSWTVKAISSSRVFLPCSSLFPAWHVSRTDMHWAMVAVKPCAAPEHSHQSIYLISSYDAINSPNVWTQQNYIRGTQAQWLTAWPTVPGLRFFTGSIYYRQGLWNNVTVLIDCLSPSRCPFLSPECIAITKSKIKLASPHSFPSKICHYENQGKILIRFRLAQLAITHRCHYEAWGVGRQ